VPLLNDGDGLAARERQGLAGLAQAMERDLPDTCRVDDMCELELLEVAASERRVHVRLPA